MMWKAGASIIRANRAYSVPWSFVINISIITRDILLPMYPRCTLSDSRVDLLDMN